MFDYRPAHVVEQAFQALLGRWVPRAAGVTLATSHFSVRTVNWMLLNRNLPRGKDSQRFSEFDGADRGFRVSADIVDIDDQSLS